MTGRSSDDIVPPVPAVPPGEVLLFSFAPIPKSYIASSYPHPIQEAKEANPEVTRDIVLCVAPMSSRSNKNYLYTDIN